MRRVAALWSATLLCRLAVATWLLLAAGCGRSPDPQSSAPPNPPGAAAQSAESLEAQEAQFDATVWRDEVLACSYERTFVKLADDFRRATNKVAVLAEFQFDEIVLPKLKEPGSALGLGIQRQRFHKSDLPALPRAQWEHTLKRLAAGGWRAAQAEWRHEKFVPPRAGSNAWSEFSFEIHGERLSARTRFIMKGTLAIDWAVESPAPELQRVRRLAVNDLTVWEREGLPGFTAHAVVTPERPERHGEMVNMHPLLVTDLNGDSHDDIIMAGVNRLMLNDGAAGFKPMEFISESVFRGSTDAGVLADFNGDGKIDFITVAKHGSLTNKLVVYSGSGNVPFSVEPVLAWSGDGILAPSVITAGDIDDDGDLDVWVAQYKPPYVGGQLPTPYYNANDGYPAYLLINDGRGTFEQQTITRGVGARRFRRTLAGSFVDLDSDHDLDLLTINDYAGVDLYHNNDKGFFSDATSTLYNPHLFGMGHCVADFDRDGLLDFLAIGMRVPTVRRLEFMKLGRPDFPDRTKKRVDMAYGNRIYLQRSGRWIEPDFSEALADTGWSWGTTAFDFDNNGALDVYVANGHISGESAEDYDSHIWTHDIYVGNSREDPNLLAYFSKPFRGINTGKTSSNGHQHNVLLMDTGTNQYVNVAYLMGVAHESDCRAVVSADLNSDGRKDLVLTEGQWFGGPATGRNRLHVHLNQLQTGNHWIGLKLPHTAQGRSAMGAKVFAKTADRTYVAQLINGDSYQSQHPNTVHFGLGQIRAVHEISIRWPNGETDRIQNPSIDQYHIIKSGQAP